MGRDGRRNIGEGASVTDGPARLTAIMNQDRDLLAGVIASQPSRIAAVIGGDHRQIVDAERAKKFRHPAIERFQGGCVTGDISSMAVNRIEIDEVGEQQSATGKFTHPLQSTVK
jgi:hypothetical protein